MSLDADDLLLFARVIEAGSFSQAGERLGLPKSTVSRRLAALENRLGEKLLQRTTRRLNLTDFGQDVLEHARALAGEVDSALSLALHRQQRPSGRLRVSMPGDLAQQVVPDVICRYIAEHPEVQLELDLSPRRVDLIGEGFDLAIRMGALADDAQLAARRLALLDAGLYASPDYLARHGEPQRPQDLELLDGLCILGRGGDAMSWSLQAGNGERWTGLPAKRTLANAPDMLVRMAVAGLGLTAVVDSAAHPHVQRGELRRVLPGWGLTPVECWAVFPGRRLLPLRSRLFIDALAARLAQCPGQPPA